MAPLDTGSTTHVLRLAEAFDRGPGPSGSDYTTLGQHLRATREHRNLSLAQVADVTRVRAAYLAALEADDPSPLPSRPFAVGYARAYARTLGLDGDAAAARFKAEHPEAAEPLRAPMGVWLDQDPRRRVIYVGAAALVAAIGLWNVAQRTLISNAPAGPAMPLFVQDPPVAPKGPVDLGAPTPPPADQTTPRAYVTPGLSVPGIDPNAAADAPAPAPSAPTEAPGHLPPRTLLYGAGPQPGQPIVRARKTASLVVRGPDGAVYFARILNAGQAYRAPLGRGLTADVSDAAAFDLYVGDQLQGVLDAPMTPLDKAAADPAKAASLGTQKPGVSAAPASALQHAP